MSDYARVCYGFWPEPPRPRRGAQPLILALVLLALLAGCGYAPTRPRYALEAPPLADSTYWAGRAADGTPHDQWHAVSWRSGILNVWASGSFICQASAFEVPRVGRYDVVYRATLPPGWALGDTIRGAWATARPDSFPVTGGSFWAAVVADTMIGRAVTLVGSPCGGTRADTLEFRLVAER